MFFCKIVAADQCWGLNWYFHRGKGALVAVTEFVPVKNVVGAYCDALGLCRFSSLAVARVLRSRTPLNAISKIWSFFDDELL